jgi:shikimate dehydrogenase
MSPRPIGGATRIAAVLGDPVEHSKSPAMHNAAYAALDLDRVYVALRVSASDLRSALNALPALGFLGVNLTVPHKEAAAKIVRSLSDEARILGAVNCVVVRDGALFGDNTDARGLERDLRANRATVAPGLAIVIGAGGGAAAAILACARMRARRIVVCNRTVARARRLCARMRSAFPQLTLEVRGLDALTDPELLANARVVINATSMGLTTSRFAPLDYAASPAGCLFYDLVYAREQTVFVAAARRAHRRAADGAGMLVGQAELAFKLFNAVPPPRDVMRRALMSALGRR